VISPSHVVLICLPSQDYSLSIAITHTATSLRKLLLLLFSWVLLPMLLIAARRSTLYSLYATIPNIDDPLRPILARLLKSLYGLKQTSKLWYENVKKTLIDFGMLPTLHDPCVFTYLKDDQVMYLSLHVDDMLVVAINSKSFDDLYDHLLTKYGEVSRAEVESHLGINIKRDRAAGTITINQPGLILTKILQPLSLAENTNPADDTPALLHEPTPMLMVSCSTRIVTASMLQWSECCCICLLMIYHRPCNSSLSNWNVLPTSPCSLVTSTQS
jgi:hypothetical protein